MTITALIAEYNPFHNGHSYHIREARRLTGADFLLVLMSGNFVQRGEPAIIEKSARAEMAIRCGADLVLELPVCYAAGSAEYFAGGAISLLNALGCVDYLCFGSESGNLDILNTVASVLSREPDDFRQKLRELLRRGLSFPLARQEALVWYLTRKSALASDEFTSDALTSALSLPNNILAIEYLKALIKSHSSIKPVTLRRLGSGYHDTAVGEFCSATALRRLFSEAECKNADACTGFPVKTAASVPTEVHRLLSANWQRSFPIFAEDFSIMLHYRLLTAEDHKSYASCFDVPEALARRIFQMRYEFTDVTSFAQLVKTRNLTEAFVRRALFHILLDLPKPGKKEGYPVYYTRLLGLRKSARELLHHIKKSGQIPLLSKLADAREIICRFYCADDSKKERALQLLSVDIRSSEIYGAACTAKFGLPSPSEYARQIFVL